ncbi:hypothetical protein DsansV1_C16g0143071 [Dioscorea sansibarensis]
MAYRRSDSEKHYSWDKLCRYMIQSLKDFRYGHLTWWLLSVSKLLSLTSYLTS